MNNPFSLEGKLILVTGASSGIGRATAIACSEMGAILVITGRNRERLNETMTMLSGTRHISYVADMEDCDTWQTLLEELPILDGIANCAGMANMNPFTFISQEELDKVMRINFSAPVMLTKNIISAKKLRKGGSIVFVSSVDGPKIVHAGNSVYSASKSALVGMARNMAVDLAGKQIRVNCVLPGTTDTPMIRTANVTEEMLAETAKQIPLKRFAKPKDIANAIVYLLSPASEFVTGTELVIDGGNSII